MKHYTQRICEERYQISGFSCSVFARPRPTYLSPCYCPGVSGARGAPAERFLGRFLGSASAAIGKPSTEVDCNFARQYARVSFFLSLCARTCAGGDTFAKARPAGVATARKRELILDVLPRHEGRNSN